MKKSIAYLAKNVPYFLILGCLTYGAYTTRVTDEQLKNCIMDTGKTENECFGGLG